MAAHEEIPKWKTIRGIYQPHGLGEAGLCIEKQKPLLAKYFPEILDCYSGTLNFTLEEPLIINHPDVKTPRLFWKDNYPAEDFGFTKVYLHFEKFSKDHQITGWIYQAMFSPFAPDPFLIEVVAPFSDIKGITRFSIKIPRKFSQLKCTVI